VTSGLRRQGRGCMIAGPTRTPAIMTCKSEARPRSATVTVLVWPRSDAGPPRRGVLCRVTSNKVIVCASHGHRARASVVRVRSDSDAGVLCCPLPLLTVK
jgi:hypothetical protein